jgi:serine/threonine protein kinase
LEAFISLMSTSTSINTSRTTTSTLSEPSEPSPSGAEIVLETSPGDESDEGRFERYQKMIGQGSFKSVWEAFDTHEGCNVAWSIVNVRSLSKEMRTATINERKLLEAVGDKSEYLINLKKTWYNAEKQEVVFITELCSGGSLNEYLKNSGTVRLSVVKKCCKQILQGLVVLHDHGAIHRDLKAENVYVQRATGNIRIGDYGLAAYSGPEAPANLGKTM